MRYIVLLALLACGDDITGPSRYACTVLRTTVDTAYAYGAPVAVITIEYKHCRWQSTRSRA